MFLAFAFWLGASLVVFALSVRYFGVSEVHFLVPILVAFGMFIFLHHPFRVYGYSANNEFTTLLVITSVLVIYGAAVFIDPGDEETANAPCGVNSPQNQCYRLPGSICRNLWRSFESSCTDEIKGSLGNRTTALIGGAVKKCSGQRFDRYFYYARGNTTDPYCINYYKSLKD